MCYVKTIEVAIEGKNPGIKITINETSVESHEVCEMLIECTL